MENENTSNQTSPIVQEALRQLAANKEKAAKKEPDTGTELVQAVIQLGQYITPRNAGIIGALALAGGLYWLANQKNNR